MLAAIVVDTAVADKACDAQGRKRVVDADEEKRGDSAQVVTCDGEP